MTDSGITVNGEPVVSDVNVTNTSVPVDVSNPVPIQNASGTQLAVTQGPAAAGKVTVSPGQSQTIPFAIPPGANAINAIVTGDGSDTITYNVVSEPSGTALIDVPTPIKALAQNEQWSALGFTDSNGNLDQNIAVSASAPSTNANPVTVSLSFLAPGQVTISEIINTPNTPVYVNLAQPSGNWAVTLEPQPGAVGPSITHTPPAGKSVYVTYATAGLLQNSTTGFISYARLSGTYGGVANKTVWEGPLGVPGTPGASAQCPPFSGGAIKFDPGATVTLSLSGTLPAAGVYGMLSMLGYDQ